MSWQRGWGEMTPGTDACPVGRGEMVALSRGELADLVAHARAQGARRALVGFGLALALVAGLAASARAETIQIGRMFVNGKLASPSTVTIAPSPEPGQLAVVTFVNEHVNEEEDNGDWSIATPDVTVSVRFTFQFNPITGADRIDVSPPAGVTCDPADCGVTVMEGFTGRVVLFQWQGM